MALTSLRLSFNGCSQLAEVSALGEGVGQLQALVQRGGLAEMEHALRSQPGVAEAVVVLGFSQGAAMALETAMARPCAAVIACSGYPHPGWSLDGTMDVPLLVLHGRDDQVVPVAAAEAIASRVVRNVRFFCIIDIHII